MIESAVASFNDAFYNKAPAHENRIRYIAEEESEEQING